MSAASLHVGHPHRHYRSTDSTNERARELAGAGAPSGTVVTADEQTAGRGRYGRSWEAPPGKALLYSAIVRPPDSQHSLLSLIAALAGCEAIESVAPVTCMIKWPNDVWIDERKVAGILIESRPPHWSVVGIGINLSIEADEFPDGLRWPATSVGNGVGIEGVFSALNRRFAARLREPHADILAAYRPRDALAGSPIEWSRAESGATVAGTARGVDDAGNLVMDGPEGIVSLSSGEVRLRVDRATHRE